MNIVHIERKSVIKTFKVEATSSRQDNAKALQEELSEILNTSVINQIEALIEKKIPEGVLFQLQQIELSIGVIHKEELKEKLPGKIVEAFDELLNTIFRKNESGVAQNGLVISPVNKANIDLFKYYLQKGNLPWWFKPLSNFNLDDYITDILQNQPIVAKKIIESTGKEDVVRKRIAYQFTEANIQLSIRVIEPQEADFIIGYHKKTVSDNLADKLTVFQVQQFKKSVWYFILNYLLAERGSAFNRKEFLKNNLSQISNSYGIDIRELSQVLYASIEATAANSFSKKEIKNLLAELMTDMADDVNDSGNEKRQQTSKNSTKERTDNLSLLLYFLQNNSLPNKYAALSESEFAEIISTLLQEFPVTSLQVFAEIGEVKNIGWLSILYTQNQLLDIVSKLFKNSLIIELVTFAANLSALTNQPALQQIYPKAATLFVKHIFKKGAVDHAYQLGEILYHLFASLNPSERASLKEYVTYSTVANSTVHQEIRKVIDAKKELSDITIVEENGIQRNGIVDYIFFLIQYGAIPWWGQIYQQKKTHELFRQLMNQSVQTAKQVLIFSGVNAQRKHRFLSYLGEDAFFELIKKAEPNIQLQQILEIINTSFITTHELINIIWSEYEKIDYNSLDKEILLIAIIAKWIQKEQLPFHKLKKETLKKAFLELPQTEISGLLNAIIQMLDLQEEEIRVESVLTKSQQLKKHLLNFLKGLGGDQLQDVYRKEELHNLFIQLIQIDTQAALDLIAFAGKNTVRQKKFSELFGESALLLTYKSLYADSSIEKLLASFKTDQLGAIDIITIFWKEWKIVKYQTLAINELAKAVFRKWLQQNKQSNSLVKPALQVLLLDSVDASILQKIQVAVEEMTLSGDSWEEEDSVDSYVSDDLFSESINISPSEGKENLAVVITEYFLKTGLFYAGEQAAVKNKKQLLLSALFFLYQTNKNTISAIFKSNAWRLENKLKLIGLLEETNTGTDLIDFLHKTIHQSLLEKVQQQVAETETNLAGLGTEIAMTDHSILLQDPSEMLDQLQKIIRQNKIPEGLKYFSDKALYAYFKNIIHYLFKYQKPALETVFLQESNAYGNKFLLYDLWAAVEIADQPILKFMQQYAAKDFFSFNHINFDNKSVLVNHTHLMDHPVKSAKRNIEVVSETVLTEPLIIVGQSEVMLSHLKGFMQHNILPQALQNLSQQALLVYFKKSIQYLFKYQKFALKELFLHKANLYANKFLLYDLWVTSEIADQPVLQFMQEFVARDFFILSIKDIGYNAGIVKDLHLVYREGVAKIMRSKSYTRKLLTQLSVLNWIDTNESISIADLAELANIPWKEEYKMILLFFQNNIIRHINQSSQKKIWLELFKRFNFLFIAKKITCNDPRYFITELFAYIFNARQEAQIDVCMEVLKKMKSKSAITNNFEEQIKQICEQQLNKRVLQITRNETILAKQKQLTDEVEQDATINKAVLDKIKAQLSKEKKNKKEIEMQELEDQGIYINNAGIVLLSPFIVAYLEKLKLLTADRKNFIDAAHQQKAIHCLQFLLDGMTEHKEFEMTLLKILCGLQIGEIIESDSFEPTENEIAIANDLIQHVINSWTKIGQSSVDGFRGNFLMRDGLLKESELEFILRVEKRGYDVLIQYIPWAFNIIKLPWMQKPIITQWI